MTECPRCDRELAQNATRCQCGWRERSRREKTEAVREPVPCAHETCHIPAKCKVQTLTGWANLCVPHYVRHHDDIARKRFTELGLDRHPNEDARMHKARVMAHMKRGRALKTFADAVQTEDEWSQT